MKSKYLSMLIAFFLAANAHAQNIFPSTGSAGIGTATPNAFSILEMISTSKGLLIPRMTKTQRNTNIPVTPLTPPGLLIYQTDNTPGFYYYSGTSGGWKAITPKAGWLLTGNAGTDPAVNFIGTTDAQPLVFKVNNQKAGYLDYINGNTGFGYQTLNANGSGVANTANGFRALYYNTSGSYNTANGYNALYSNTKGVNNTANGYGALLSNGTGNNNTANGYQALYSNTTGFNNTANGAYVLYSNSEGHNNTANGYRALFTNTTGYYNAATGAFSLENNIGGIGNTGSGISALRNNTNGNDNTGAGANALYNNTTGYSNVAVGSNALFNNTNGNNNVAVGDSALYHQNGGFGSNNSNTAVGSKALYSNTTGGVNTASGYSALFSNTTGGGNTAAGYQALHNNTTSSKNTATGCQALYGNTMGSQNTANGFETLFINASGSDNTANGTYALLNNTTGSSNSAFGISTLSGNQDGSGNTAIGYFALSSNFKGNNNTAVGFSTGGNGDYYGSSAFGHNATITASNQVRIGDATVLSIGGYKAWTNLSDGRVKKNIKENVPGLAFINLLKPITYNLDLDAADKIAQRPAIKDKSGKTMQPSQEEMNARNIQQKIVCTGFIAQDVEATAKKIGYDFDGVDAAKSDKDLYGLRYSEFVVPLVKAVQELSSQNEKLKKQNEEQQQINSDLQNRLAKLEVMMNVHQSTTNLSSASLDQNVPNPFSNTTTINYSLPQSRIGGTSAKIIVIDESGNTIKIFNLSGTGKGSINFSAPSRVGASYQYSLFVDGKLIDTKQMVLTK